MFVLNNSNNYLVGLGFAYSCVVLLCIGTLLLGVAALFYAQDLKNTLISRSAWLSNSVGSWLVGLTLLLSGIGGGTSLLLLKGSVVTSGGLDLLCIASFGRAVVFLNVSYAYRLRSRSSIAFEYDILVVFSCAAIVGMRMSNNLLIVYLFLELATLCGLILVGSDVASPRSTEAALKYFLMSARTTGVFLIGAVLVYYDIGSLMISDLVLASHGECGLASWGGILIVVSFLVKLGVAPFHHWAPDVYDGAPLSTTVFLNLVPKIGRAAFVFMTITNMDLSMSVGSLVWLQYIGVASLLFGTLGGLFQVRLKRFLAYSSISHMGYMVIALSCGGQVALESVLLYLLVYLFTSLRVWVSLLASEVIGVRPIDKLSDLGGLASTNPARFGIISVGIFSIAARPPFAGFLAKYFVLAIPIQAGLYGLVLFSLAMSVVSTFFYLRIVMTISFGNTQVMLPLRFVGLSSSFIGGGLTVVLSSWLIDPSYTLDLVQWTSLCLSAC